jgi:hypothetical protein
MPSEEFRLGYPACRALIEQRLSEPAPGRIQLLCGPRQVQATTRREFLLDGPPGTHTNARAG